MNNSNFCYLPFTSSLIKTNGDITVCCHYKKPADATVFNIKTHSVEEWAQSKDQETLRSQMLNGEYPQGCNYCYSLDKKGFESIRSRTLTEYKMFKPSITEPEVIDLEVNIGNLCNLKCMMCYESSSSELLKENKELKISNFNQSDFVWSKEHYDNFYKILDSKKLKLLNIRGGEPLFSKKIKQILQDLPTSALEKTLLHITSNMTIWDDEWAEIFSKFKYVRLMASIDGIANTYEYIRFPGSWEETSRNLMEVNKLSNVNMILRCTIQNLNIVYLDDFVNWANSNNLYIGKGAYGILLDPKIFSHLNLSPYLKELAISRLSKIKNSPEMIDVLLSNLKESSFDENNWNDFVKHIKMKDEYRQINIKDYLPDFQIY